MGSILQKEDGQLVYVKDISDVNSIIQLIQLADGNLKSLSSLNKNELILSFKKDIQIEKIRDIKVKILSKLIYLRLKNGLSIILPEEFNLISTSDARLVYKKVSELRKGNFVAIPPKYNTIHKKIKFDAWDLDDFLFISGIKDWYSKKLETLIKNKKLLIRDIARDLDIPYWKIRRNALSKKSINYGFLKKFIKKYLKEKELYDMISISNGFKNEKSASKYAKMPFNYTEELAYLNAILVGEGHIVKNEKQAILEFSDMDFTAVLKRLIKKVHRYKQKGNRINLPGSLAYFYSRFLKIPKGNKSKIVSFPPLALQSNKETLSGAIRGIIDGEGSINTAPHSKSITITTSSFRLVLGISSALLRIGVSCSIRKSNKDSTWTVCINRGNIEKFVKEVKFLRSPKKHKALLIMNQTKSKERIIVPNVGNYIKNLRKKSNLSSTKLAKMVGLSNISPMERLGNFSLESLTKINKIFKDKKIDKLIKTNVRWNKVIDIRKIQTNTKFIFPKTEGFFLLNHIFIKG